MPLNRSGISSGLLGYTLKKELFGDTLFWRETQVFDYELISLNLTGSNFSSSAVHSYILNDFTSRFSGDINVKVFQTQADYSFPNDSLRAIKYNVQVEVRSIPLSVGQIQTELSGNFYTGVTPSFFVQYTSGINDLKEEFSFERNEAGVKSFVHNLSFGLVTGTVTDANTIASGIFSTDYNTTFGILGFSGGAALGDTGLFRNYYTETFDTFRNTYSFSKKRDSLPITGARAASPYSYNYKHRLDMRENGIVDISEMGNVKGAISFINARNSVFSLITGAYNRCGDVFNRYKNSLSSLPITFNLWSGAKKTSINYNQLSAAADYEIVFTSDPQFSVSGISTVETMDLSCDEKNLVEIKHSFDYSFNKRYLNNTNIISLLSGVNLSSPQTVTGYYLNSQFYNTSLPIKLINSSFSWPFRKNRASANFQYSNHPRFFVTVNGVFFYFLDSKIQNTKPIDITTEYKVINRPSGLSVINYAYQTERGQIQISLDAGLGKNPNEFATTFRNNISSQLTALYRYSIELFMKQFVSVIPIAFTYQLSDIKYVVNSEGLLQLTVTVDYTLKRHSM